MPVILGLGKSARRVDVQGQHLKHSVLAMSLGYVRQGKNRKGERRKEGEVERREHRKEGRKDRCSERRREEFKKI